MIEFHVVELEVKDVPVSSIIRRVPDSIFSFDVGDPGGTSVGLKSFLLFECEDLISDLFVVLFKVFHPRKLIGVPVLIEMYHQG